MAEPSAPLGDPTTHTNLTALLQTELHEIIAALQTPNLPTERLTALGKRRDTVSKLLAESFSFSDLITTLTTASQNSTWYDLSLTDTTPFDVTLEYRIFLQDGRVVTPSVVAGDRLRWFDPGRSEYPYDEVFNTQRPTAARSKAAVKAIQVRGSRAPTPCQLST
eukprot:TRINITY_DN70427_c0_g1_i1.p1 TRINITY_DN70427_c0_g1~~TRINITY_DN70427_c0_g1_i1.p1  ORF type:complete len:177 (-),score=9.60 TRINITY_DN70427_c0_g1_i1:148-639(-)